MSGMISLLIVSTPTIHCTKISYTARAALLATIRMSRQTHRCPRSVLKSQDRCVFGGELGKNYNWIRISLVLA
ncbi:hypothetical protein GGR58DRAFT_451136 [Xylaria digitata]|nr:hypothetical protein GGR58DRAFT_451136 [Xylaria digitata]